jgi:hypothetical protein
MAAPKTKTPPAEVMTKDSWRAQKALREVDEWARWVTDSANGFIDDMAQMKQKRGMPADDVGNLSDVLTQLTELRKSLKLLDKSIHRATGRRIQQARRRL